MATLVASGAPSAAVFSAVAEEVATVMHLPMVGVYRYDSDGLMTVIATWSDRPHVLQPGTRWPLDGQSMVAQVRRTGRPARIEDYTGLPGALADGARVSGLNATAGAPIIVDGSVWGAMGMSSPDAPLPEHAEDRLAEFTELIATAIANGQAQDKLRRLAEEQAALRRVATLVARGVQPAEVFEAVSAEVGRLVPADAAAIIRFGTDGTVTSLGAWTRAGGYRIEAGVRFSFDPGTVARLVHDTHRPARINGYEGVPGDGAALGRAAGWRSTVGAPIIVEGRLWGVVNVASTTEQPLPADTEERLADFTELVATAVANAESRAEIEASRARIVSTADATRRRIQRDLHDGAQQQLVSLALELRAAEAATPPELPELRAELSRAVTGLIEALDGLREIAQGIHPAVLAEGGLAAALKTLARRSPIPVSLDVPAGGRLPEHVEVAAYYVVSEALTNAAKYSRASKVGIEVAVRDRVLRVTVSDDGIGGADPARGSGLLGLKDRAEAIGGTMCVDSRPGGGTNLIVELPLGSSS
ncbi:MAG TPA: GAF domain-containing sensor histidine kinase [Micromonosporaceae bacterium]|nr:GAF domain-containing sensor histidine kinase [Micromonosporaceae bacterium]